MRFINSLLVVGVVVVAGMGTGCASSNESDEEATAGSEAAITASHAYQKLLVAHIFKDQGHLACGHTLTLTGDGGTTGRFTYVFQPCDEVGGTMRVKGSFEVVGGWLGGLLTAPKLEIKPDPSPDFDEDNPWSYKIYVETSGRDRPVNTVYLETEEGGILAPQSSFD